MVGHGRTLREAPAKFSPRRCLCRSRVQLPAATFPRTRRWSGSSVTAATPGSTWPAWAAATVPCKRRISAAPPAAHNEPGQQGGMVSPLPKIGNSSEPNATGASVYPLELLINCQAGGTHTSENFAQLKMSMMSTMHVQRIGENKLIAGTWHLDRKCQMTLLTPRVRSDRPLFAKLTALLFRCLCACPVINQC